MKQILQDLSTGKTAIVEVPEPAAHSGQLTVETSASLVSSGTERTLVDFGRAGWIGKARQQPGKAREVIQKAQTDGLWATIEAVRSKLASPLSLGYSAVGVVRTAGLGVKGFRSGQRVASNGPHAEVVLVPENLVAKIPDAVSDEEAAFTVISAIALQGIRLINPTFGETVVVTGLGLIGLIASQLLLANGCRVIGLDFDQSKVDLATSWGVEAFSVAGLDVVAQVQSLCGGGADAVLSTASSKSNDIITQAAQMCRKRGRIVLVGVIGLDLHRSAAREVAELDQLLALGRLEKGELRAAG